MKFDLKELAKRKLIMVAHMGTKGANIPGNTLAAFQIALRDGADMIEVDVSRSADGELFVFHPGMEKKFLYHTDACIPEMKSDEIKKLRFKNFSGAETQFGISHFDEFLRTFKDKCFINVDKFQDHPEEIAAAIRAHGMSSQVLVKTLAQDQALEIIQKYCPEMPYLCMAWKEEDIDKVLEYDLNYVGNEVVFAEDTHTFAQDDFIRRQHELGYLVWCNSIVFDYKKVLSGGHNDDSSLCEHPDKGWGWIADKGYDFMQTDWTLQASTYLKNTGRMYRKF